MKLIYLLTYSSSVYFNNTKSTFPDPEAGEYEVTQNMWRQKTLSTPMAKALTEKSLSYQQASPPTKTQSADPKQNAAGIPLR